MAKTETILNSLEKLYAKRAVLDKQIIEAQKKLAVEVRTAAKAEKKLAVGKNTAKSGGKPSAKAVGRKPRAKKAGIGKPAVATT